MRSIAFTDLDARIAGRVVTPAAADWDAVRQGFNLTGDLRPAAIALAAEAADVVAAVAFAREHGLRVAAQSTGHNASAYGDVSDVLLVDVRDLQGITVDVEGRRARVGAGVRWRAVVEQLSEHGLAALHGSSPTVGIAGYSLGGGMGWLARKHGLQANAVTAFDVVTADAELVRVDAEHEPDLFWALRGGNGNFGVVTAVEFEVFAVGQMYAGAMFFTPDQAQEVLHVWADSAPALPEEMMTWASLMHFPDFPEVPAPLRDRPFLVVHGVHLGTEDEGRALLAPLRDLAPALDTFAMVAPDALADLAMDPVDPVPYHSTTALLGELTPALVDRILAATEVASETGSDWTLPLVQIRQMGGALARRTPGAGARATLEGEYCVFALGVVVDEATAREVGGHLAALDRALAPARVGRYPNFVEEPTETGAFFDAETWERLRTVKAAHDPAGLFLGNHRIPGAEVADVVEDLAVPVG